MSALTVSSGDGARGAPSPLRRRVVTSTHRTVTPEETWARIQPQLAGMGITRVTDVTGLDTVGIPVALAVRPNGRSLSVAQGKGVTVPAAMVSAAMESIETHHAEHVELPNVIASYQELTTRGRARLDPTLLAKRTNGRFRPDLRIPWVEATGLVTGRSVLAPLEMVDMDCVRPRPYTTRCFYGGTNGLASGNCYEEAVVHGVCEVIERDAKSLWWHRTPAEQAATRVDLSTATCDPVVASLVDRFAAADTFVAVWDMTSDVGVAAFAALAVDNPSPTPGRVPVSGGHGCHPDRRVALMRALTEVAQARLTGITGSRDDISRASIEDGRDGPASDAYGEKLAAQPTPRRFDAIPHVDHGYVENDIDFLVGRLHDVGVPEPVTVDLTESGIAIPVVKVIGPGLEPNPAEAVAAGPRLRAALEGRRG